MSVGIFFDEGVSAVFLVSGLPITPSLVRQVNPGAGQNFPLQTESIMSIENLSNFFYARIWLFGEEADGGKFDFLR